MENLGALYRPHPTVNSDVNEKTKACKRCEKETDNYRRITSCLTAVNTPFNILKTKTYIMYHQL